MNFATSFQMKGLQGLCFSFELLCPNESGNNETVKDLENVKLRSFQSSVVSIFVLEFNADTTDNIIYFWCQSQRVSEPKVTHCVLL